MAWWPATSQSGDLGQVHFPLVLALAEVDIGAQRDGESLPPPSNRVTYFHLLRFVWGQGCGAEDKFENRGLNDACGEDEGKGFRVLTVCLSYLTILPNHPFYYSLFLFSPTPRFQINLSTFSSSSEWYAGVLPELSQGWSCEAVVLGKIRKGPFPSKWVGWGQGRAGLLVCSTVEVWVMMVEAGKVGLLDGSDTAEVGPLPCPPPTSKNNTVACQSVWTKAFSSVNLPVAWVKEVIITTASQIQVSDPLICLFVFCIKLFVSNLAHICMYLGQAHIC